MKGFEIYYMLDRKIELQATRNTRDLGGLTTVNGNVTKFGVYARSDSIANLTPQDITKLIENNLDTIIDMRMKDELSDNLLSILKYKSIHYYWIPIEFSSKCDGPMCLSKLYVEILETKKLALREIFLRLANAKGLCLFNCNGGKDRTGIVSMLLLDIANVELESIIDDYMETEINMAPIFNKIRQHIKCNQSDIPIGGLQCLPKFVKETLNYIKKTYLSTWNYLNSIGVQDAVIISILQRFI